MRGSSTIPDCEAIEQRAHGTFNDYYSNTRVASIQCLDSYTQLLYLSILEYVVLCRSLVESEHSFLNFKSSSSYYDVSILDSRVN